MEEQVAIFCDIDDFCKDYEEYCTHYLLMDKNEVVPKTKMALSEIMTILIMYHLSGYNTHLRLKQLSDPLSAGNAFN